MWGWIKCHLGFHLMKLSSHSTFVVCTRCGKVWYNL